MKAIYLKAIKQELAERIPEILPGFSAFKLRLTREERSVSRIESSEQIYRQSLDGLELFLVFGPHNRQEELYVDLAWSAKGRFPYALERPSVMLESGRNEFEKDEAIFGFDQLYFRSHGKNHFGWPVWECSVDIDHPDYQEIFVREDMMPVTEEFARERARLAVRNCLNDLKREVLPYFEALIAHKGAR